MKWRKGVYIIYPWKAACLYKIISRICNKFSVKKVKRPSVHSIKIQHFMQIMKYHLLYSREWDTEKYTVRLFPICLWVWNFTFFCLGLYNKQNITRWLEDDFYLLVLKTIFYSLAALVREILFSPLENKSHIFAPPCNTLYIS
jgi:hypothetical protein